MNKNGFKFHDSLDTVKFYDSCGAFNNKILFYLFKYKEEETKGRD